MNDAFLLFALDREGSKFTVFVGASLGLIVVSGIGVLADGVMSQYISEKHLHYIAGIGFIGIGIWTLLKAYAVGRSGRTHSEEKERRVSRHEIPAPASGKEEQQWQRLQ